jgi:uncharacterized small protein (DUF1192 family)
VQHVISRLYKISSHKLRTLLIKKAKIDEEIACLQQEIEQVGAKIFEENNIMETSSFLALGIDFT